MKKESYNRLIQSPEKFGKRVFLAVGFTGLVRVEWMFGRYGQVIPCNWSQIEHQMWLPTFGPLGWLVAEARNVAVKVFLENKFEWIFFIDHDTVLPQNFFLVANDRMIKENIPVWSGLYFTKSFPAEPLIYRGRGTGYYASWKMGDKVWADAIPMGCTVIHRSILKAVWDESEEYLAGNERVRKVFETPQKAWFDPEQHGWQTLSGTEDLNFCWKLIDHGIFKKAGWPEFQKKRFPFLVDTGLFCKHIDPSGVLYPSQGEEKYWERKKKKNEKN